VDVKGLAWLLLVFWIACAFLIGRKIYKLKRTDQDISKSNFNFAYAIIVLLGIGGLVIVGYFVTHAY
jgi:hypothetical protein